MNNNLVTERLVSESLMKIGIPCHVKGFIYLKEAVSQVLADRSLIEKITAVLNPRIAQKFNTTPSRVERAIRHSIEMAWDTTDHEQIKEVLGPWTPTTKMISSRFIATLAVQIGFQLQKAS